MSHALARQVGAVLIAEGRRYLEAVFEPAEDETVDASITIRRPEDPEHAPLAIQCGEGYYSLNRYTYTGAGDLQGMTNFAVFEAGQEGDLLTVVAIALRRFVGP